MLSKLYFALTSYYKYYIKKILKSQIMATQAAFTPNKISLSC